MAKANVETLSLSPAPIDPYRQFLDEKEWARFEVTMSRFAARLRGRTLWNINSTARGGGVAELLAALVPYDLGAGIDERWAVIEGRPAFFDLTKKIHTLLHGVDAAGVTITEEERRIYEDTLAANAAALLDVVRPGDVAVLHDPQTAGLVPALASRGVHTVWRSHIGVDRPNDVVRVAWRFLVPYLAPAKAYVFSRRAYVWEDLDPSCVRIMPPCIDPFTSKNRDMTADEVAATLARTPLHETLPPEARAAVQVSRWDRLKDPIGVLRAFARHIAPVSDAWLVLAGPQVDSVDDDPEQPGVLRELREARDGLDPDTQRRVIIAELSMRDIEQNALMVNAVQRRADLVMQKSLAEGFGLTVSEAMWKEKPVVASRVGGIEDQIEHGKSGILVDDPADLASFGAAVVDLLNEPPRAAELGRQARLRIAREYLAPRHLRQQAELVTALL